jgi:hypothetical protein
MWVVEIVKVGTRFDFRGDYFPRKFYYKADAIRLKNEVESKGGEAIVKKFTKEVSNEGR